MSPPKQTRKEPPDAAGAGGGWVITEPTTSHLHSRVSAEAITPFSVSPYQPDGAFLGLWVLGTGTQGRFICAGSTALCRAASLSLSLSLFLSLVSREVTSPLSRYSVFKNFLRYADSTWAMVSLYLIIQ